MGALLRDNLGEDAVEKVMGTTAEKFIEKGRIEGKAEGLMEGKAKGRIEGRADLLLKQLELKFGKPRASTIERVRKASAEEIDTWGTRVLTAKTLANVWKKQARRKR
jgi:hypothetical protein